MRDDLRTFVRTLLEAEWKTNRASIVYVHDPDRGVLSVSRKDDPTQLGLPGGKVDPGETPYQAARRELKEETGLDCSNLKLIFVARDDTDHEVFCFTADVEGTIETDEVGALKWVTHDDLLDPKISPYHEYNARLFKAIDVL